MNNNEKKIIPVKNYLQFSSMAFQMGIIITLGTIGGVKLDKLWNTSPILTLIGALSSIFLSTYLVINDLIIKNNKKNAKKSD